MANNRVGRRAPQTAGDGLHASRKRKDDLWLLLLALQDAENRAVPDRLDDPATFKSLVVERRIIGDHFTALERAKNGRGRG